MKLRYIMVIALGALFAGQLYCMEGESPLGGDGQIVKYGAVYNPGGGRLVVTVVSKDACRRPTAGSRSLSKVSTGDGRWVDSQQSVARLLLLLRARDDENKENR